MKLSYDEVGRHQTGGHIIYAVIKIWELPRLAVDQKWTKTLKLRILQKNEMMKVANIVH